MSPAALTKSRFISGVQCLKRLYLQAYQPELAADQNDSAVAMLQQGLEVGEVARGAFSGGVLVRSGEQNLIETINKTTQLVAGPNVQTIFEGTFQRDNIVVRTDILTRKPESGWQLIEVKSSTDVKEHYPYDVGIQQYVLNALGLKTSPCLMYLNRDYIYKGGNYEFDKLFIIRNLEQEIDSLRGELASMIVAEEKALSQPVPPAVSPGPQCKKPVPCEFYNCCNAPKPVDHVSLLPGISLKKVHQLTSKGIDSIRKIPPDFPLSDRQRRACNCVQTRETYIAHDMKETFDLMVYPLLFMDFETVSYPIPRYVGMRPYDHLPFQWSVHAKRNTGGRLEHHEYLAEDGRDPRLPFLTSLLGVLGPKGHIVVYNRSFESQRLSDLARWFPRYTDSITKVQARLWDLLDIVRKNVYHPRFMGSYSLKSVLPALIPEMTYDEMEVSHGEEAGLAWKRLIGAPISEVEKLRLRNALLAYCRQDTLAMVQLLEFLAQSSSNQ